MRLFFPVHPLTLPAGKVASLAAVADSRLCADDLGGREARRPR